MDPVPRFVPYIWRKNMVRCLSLDIIISSKLIVFLKLHSQKTLPLLECKQMMSTDKYDIHAYFHTQQRLLILWIMESMTSSFPSAVQAPQENPKLFIHTAESVNRFFDNIVTKTSALKHVFFATDYKVLTMYSKGKKDPVGWLKAHQSVKQVE